MGVRYYIKRVTQAFVTFLTGMFLTYVLYRLIPGGPIDSMRTQIIQRATQQGRPPDPERLGRLTEAATGINTNQGPIVGYINYISEVLTGNFGESIIFGRPVFDLLFDAMPWSMFISIYGFIGGLSMTILFGTLMAYKEGTKLDKGLTVFIMVVNSVPYYVVAILLLVTLGVQWEVLPTGGRYPSGVEAGFNLPFMIGIVEHAAMPILSNFLVGFAGGAIGMRALGVRVIGADYIRSAEIRGIGRNRIMTRYIARNTILPIYTGVVIGIAGVFSSSVILEEIFNYHAVGFLLFEAFTMQDYPMIMGSFILLTGLTVVGMFVADVTYGFVDPRAGDPSEREAY